jgi:hypothetical protein
MAKKELVTYGSDLNSIRTVAFISLQDVSNTPSIESESFSFRFSSLHDQEASTANVRLEIGTTCAAMGPFFVPLALKFTSVPGSILHWLIQLLSEKAKDAPRLSLMVPEPVLAS